MVSVTTPYPGASPIDVETNVTGPLEDELREIADIEKITSMSMEHLSIIMLVIDIDAKDPEKVKNEIRAALDRAENLPQTAQNPTVYEIRSSNVPVMEISLTGDVAELELRRHARNLETRLQTIDGLGAIDKIGYRKREIQINADLEKMKEHHVSFAELNRAIRARNIRLSGGTLESYITDKKIVTAAEYQEPLDVQNVIIRSTFTGNKLRVKDVADVEDGFEEPRIKSQAFGENSIALVLRSQDNADTITLSDHIRARLAEYSRTLPPGVKARVMYDFSSYTRELIQMVLINGLLGFILVLIVMFIFLDRRSAFWTAMGIPISLAGTFVLFQPLGLTLNIITLISVILVLGILVDDAIVVAENIHRLKQTGLGNREATLEGVRQVIRPITAAVATTALAFAPMMFMGGMMGKFVFTIPAVVLALLGFSLLESLFILPAHLERAPLVRQTALAKTGLERLKQFYGCTLRFCLKHRWKSIAAILSFSLTILIASPYLVNFTLIHQKNFDIFNVIIETPTGTSLNDTSKAVARVEELLNRRIPEEALQSFTTRIGHHTTDPYGTSAGEYSNWALVTVYLLPASQRSVITEDLFDALNQDFEKLKGFQRLDIEYMSDGPPVGKPITLIIKGEEDEVRAALEKASLEFLESQAGVRNVQSNNVRGKDELRLILDYDRLAKAGLTAYDVSATVRSAFDGEVVTSLRKNNEEIDFRVRLKDRRTFRARDVLQLTIPNGRGALIPLRSFAHFEESTSAAVIHHASGLRSVTVTADVDSRITTPGEENRKLMAHIQPLTARYPGLSVEAGGEEQETVKSLYNFMLAFLLALVSIYFLLVLLFDSYWQPVLILTAVPSAIVGVIITFMIHSTPLDFMALIGVLGLLGVVVNATIVMVSHMNDLTGNDPSVDNLLQAALNRFRPVLLTTISTVVGLLPTAYGLGGESPFFGTMVLAMTWGLLYATAISLILTPLLFSFRLKLK